MTLTSQEIQNTNWLLDDFVSRVPNIRHVVLLSADGLAVGASSEQDRADAERLAAIASGLHSLAKGMSAQFSAGAVLQNMVELERGFFFVVTAGKGSCLAVLSEMNADIGLIAYEMARLVQQVREHLDQPVRTPLGQPFPGLDDAVI
ncbi:MULTISPECIES: roadblock/LC7 domain-containing protein [unclassified Streptomyces]|uniref:Roadblock/LC7 domain-containing protein n=1 Tax=Streptomyces sp. NBC_00060 TaxID=2975636 RepID=A0AAU2GRC0_9ACTN